FAVLVREQAAAWQSGPDLELRRRARARTVGNRRGPGLAARASRGPRHRERGRARAALVDIRCARGLHSEHDAGDRGPSAHCRAPRRQMEDEPEPLASRPRRGPGRPFRLAEARGSGGGGDHARDGNPATLIACPDRRRLPPSFRIEQAGEPNVPVMTGKRAFLELLKQEGVEILFGNPGTTELPLMDALATENELRYVLALQEAAVVAMADGYAQAS